MPRREAEPALARFTGTGRRFEVSEAGGVTIVDDYAHHPTELAATIAAVREAYPGRRLRVLFQPHLYSRTRHLAGELGAALAAADDVAVTDDLRRARGSRSPASAASSSSTRSRTAARLAAWMPTVEQGAAYLARRAEPGDVLLVIGAGDVDRAPALLRERASR